jgi:tRNA (guanine-N7-)-methyltransferase
LDFTINSPKFYGRRKGRKLTPTASLALKKSKNYFINCTNQELNFIELFSCYKKQKIILEIGFGNGDNLVQSATNYPESLYIGAEPFLNSTVQCIQKLKKNNITNVKIWHDDVKKIINFIPANSISEIKILFPDPWPKTKHKNRRLIQPIFIEHLSLILNHNGIITVATDHPVLKSWILEQFHSNQGFEWLANESKDWRIRPLDCFSTKYEKKAYKENRVPSWFIYKKTKG